MSRNVFDYSGYTIVDLTPKYQEPTSWTGVIIQIGVSVVAFFVLCDAFSPMLNAGGIYDVPAMLIDAVKSAFRF